jgi:hypothetical protein
MMNDFSSMFQSMISWLLRNDPEWRQFNHHSQWIKSICVESDECGLPAYVIVDLRIPTSENIPTFKYGRVEIQYENGRAVSRKAVVRLKIIKKTETDVV